MKYSNNSYSTATRRNLMYPGLTFLITDMQTSFLKDIRKPKKHQLIDSHKELLELCGVFDIPVVAIYYDNIEPTIEELSIYADKIPYFKQLERTTTRGNGFLENPELKKTLKELETRITIIGGVNSGICAKLTSQGAIEEGYKIATSSKLIADSLPHRHKKALYWFKKNGIYGRDPYELLIKCGKELSVNIDYSI